MRTASLGPFNITDDNVAGERTEKYSLVISNSSIAQNVIANDSTDISIINDDSKLRKYYTNTWDTLIIIALEPNKHYMLKLKNLGILRLGNPGAINITVVNDDSKKIEWEKEREYMGVECHAIHVWG